MSVGKRIVHILSVGVVVVGIVASLTIWRVVRGVKKMPAVEERHVPFSAADAASDFPFIWTGSGIMTRAKTVET